MKKLLTTIIIFTLCTNFLYSQNDGDILFDDSFLHEIRFENTDTNLFITTKNYQQLKMIVDGNTVEDIGFKRKGNISGYSNPNKFGIKVKTNKYINGQKYDGIKEFTLHMNYTDPTMMREKLTYDLCSDMGLYSLRTAFAKVYINDNYWGLYTLVEGKDEMYKQVFNHRDMDAIESLDFGDLCYISNTPSDYDADNNGSWPTYLLENGNPTTAWQRFTTLMDKANNTPINQYLDTVSTYLNLEHFFKYQAINVYLMNMDSYISFKGNQIFVYDTTAKLWQITPWDFNASFGLWNTSSYTPDSYEMIPYIINNGCIASMLNSVPQLKTYYLDAMCELTNILGDTTAYFAKIDNLKNQIQQAVYEDNRKHLTNTDFDEGIEYGYHAIFGENQPALKTFLTERLAIVKQGLIDENYNCISTIGVKESKEYSIPYHIYPNPSSHTINIEFTENVEENYEIRILNTCSKELYYSTQSESINIETFDSGIYLIVLKNGSDNHVCKFIKE